MVRYADAVRLRIPELLEEHGLTPYRLSKRSGGRISLSTAYRLVRLKGRVILLPTMNHPAVLAGTRVSPIDGVNMNRCFPGQREGTPTRALAHYVYHHLVARADVVVDLHSGGKTLDFVPSVVMHELDDPVRMEQTKAAILAMGAPLALILKELDTAGMLDSAVEDLGKLFITTELGGGGSTTSTGADVDADAPPLSVTVRVTL